LGKSENNVLCVFGLFARIFCCLGNDDSRPNQDYSSRISRITRVDFSDRHQAIHQETLKNVVGLVDSFLVSIFLLIFSYGIYELFVSELDPARQKKEPSEGDRAIMSLLSIRSLDDLKHNLIKVISVILIVTLFENAVAIKLQNPTELVLFAGAIVLIALAMFLINAAGASWTSNKK
jgi:uncharacterized membrane protein YqhA